MLEEIKNLSIYTNIMCVSFRSLIYSLTRDDSTCISSSSIKFYVALFYYRKHKHK